MRTETNTTSMKIASLVVLFIPLLLLSGCRGKAEHPVARPEAEETVRILIKEGTMRLRIEGAEERSPVTVSYQRDGSVRLNGRRVALPIRLHPDREFILIERRPYRGTIEIDADDRGIVVINELGLEDYVAGIINSEISSKWHMEVLRAQSVIARTYAMYQKRKREHLSYHLTATNMHQLYGGAHREDERVIRAVSSTRGEVLFYRDEPVLAAYHSNAGGITEYAREVWSKDYPYLRPVKSRYDSLAPNYRWEAYIEATTMEEALHRAGHRLTVPVAMIVKKRTSTGRAKKIGIRGAYGRTIVLKGEELRKLLGYGVIKSTLFSVKKRGRFFIFQGRGSGHGVGLSQWGARGMAERGYSYREILGHYYPGTRVKRIY